MRRIAKKIFDVLEVHLAAFIFLVLIFSVVIQVFSRYVLNRPLPRLFELSIYSFVWAIYLGASLAKRYRRHICFDVLYRKFPRKVQLLIDIGFDLLTNVVFFILLIPSIQYTAWNYRIKSSTLRIPWTYLLVCFPIFVGLILIHNSVWIYRYIRELLGKKISPEEVPPWQ
ncbi:MAG: TRAP transporter small permease [bacterium]